MFIKELQLNIDQFSQFVDDKKLVVSEKKDSTIEEYLKNLTDGIAYYRQLIPQISEESATAQKKMLTQISEAEEKINTIKASAPALFQ